METIKKVLSILGMILMMFSVSIIWLDGFFAMKTIPSIIATLFFSIRFGIEISQKERYGDSLFMAVLCFLYVVSLSISTLN